MALTATDLETQLTAIQAAIATAIASPAPNWRIGSVSFDQTGYLKFLYDQQTALIEQLRKFPSESIDVVQNAVDSFGNDGTEYYNEDF